MAGGACAEAGARVARAQKHVQELQYIFHLCPVEGVLLSVQTPLNVLFRCDGSIV